MYENFGFSANIFNTKPLNLNQEDLEKFIGRTKDIKSFLINISSTKNATLIITGHRGVGKTSFVNIMEYAIGFDRNFLHQYMKVTIPNLIPCYHKIQLEPEDDAKSVLIKSLSSLLFSIKKYSEEKKDKLSKEIKELTDWVSEVSSSRTQAGQLQFSGFGGGYSQSKTYQNISEIPTNILQNKIERVVKLAKDRFQIDGMILNINNVDIIEEKKFCEIFNQLRDYLLTIEGLWNIIIGQPGIYSSLYQQATRVAEVISGQEVKLDPLSEEDIIAVLKKRQKIYSKNPKKLSEFPIEEKFIREIYKNSEGEIRQVLKACDDIVRFVFGMNPNINIINSEIGRDVLKNVLSEQLDLKNLKEKDREIISKILKKGSLRPKDYAELKLKSATDFTNKMKSLIKKNFLKKEVRGNVSNYKVTGVIHLAKYAEVDI